MAETKQWIVENDNKENNNNASTITIQKFVTFYSDRTNAPYPEIMQFLNQL
ncbi:MAG: hypothetical protein V4667_10890 [Bacteroidota bacterium]